MANPRQRRKTKSGSSNKPSKSAKRRQHQKLVKAPEIKGPDVLKQAWDKKLTVRQNYAKLGLLPSLSPYQSGGLERSDPYHPANLAAAAAAAQASSQSDKPKKGMARIVRDADGNVVDIIEADQEEESTPWGKPLKDVVESDEPVDNWMPPRVADDAQPVVTALKELEAQAAPVFRHTSAAERTWLHDMVQKYGDDVESMAKDRKINLLQKTAGEIRRAINKAGGFEVLAQ
ncbi:Nucleolar protein 16 [Thecaphora frezii]